VLSLSLYACIALLPEARATIVLSGAADWSEDIGGFWRPADAHTNASYHRLLIRWFQFGCFTPIFRVHGTNDGGTELWKFGNATRDIIVASAVRLRYRLLPYIYSGFWRVSAQHYTMQRGLAFDFGADAQARAIGDAFMFGDALLVAPLVADTNWRAVYLPMQTGWRNFYTGAFVANERGRTAGTDGADGTHNITGVTLSEMPLFVRNGSIVVLGPDLQWTGERPADPLEVRVYAGGDAAFTLYEDDGESADTTASSTISLHYNETGGALTIGARKGLGFAGMLLKRTFNIVLVRPGHGVGVAPTVAVDASVAYMGDQVVVPLV